METTKNKYSGILVFLCSAVYFVSYLTRINYAAVMVEITKSLNISKTAASLALTASAISYGFGQIVSGYLGDKFKPEKIIVSGLICTSLMNLLIPLTASPGYMTAIWFVNGLAQAMMWPPMVKIMTSMLNDEEYKKGCIKVFWGSSTATIFIYIAAPFIIRFCIFGGMRRFDVHFLDIRLQCGKEKSYCESGFEKNGGAGSQRAFFAESIFSADFHNDYGRNTRQPA